ncbi:MAG: hypothetical protein BGP16_05425 [Sphingobium sp. 66-54]|nr:MAG: hypothetical protein BGP16_05425 [Sphingobium sp. 66-54]
MSIATINLGDRVRDKITGVEGIVIGITDWLTACRHIGVKREGVDKDGKPWEMMWFDEPNVTVIQPGVYAPAQPDPATGLKAGGPIPNGR